MFPRDIVCLRNVSISTLHKGDYDGDDDDDDDNNNNNNNNNNSNNRSITEVIQNLADLKEELKRKRQKTTVYIPLAYHKSVSYI